MKTPPETPEPATRRSSPPPHCPILEDAARLQELSHDLTRTMRKLRQDMKKCYTCSAYQDCPVLADFNRQVQTALDEIMEEWNL